MELPDVIHDEAELDEVLSRPWSQLVDFASRWDGDLMVLGAGGKIGPTMVRMARRALDEAGADRKVIAVDLAPLDALRTDGVEVLACDLLDPRAVADLPPARNVIYMVGRKFGSTGEEHLTWAMNAIAPAHAAAALGGSRIVAFSTGCVYPILDLPHDGCTEQTPPEPIGEYAMSCLGRERMFDYYSRAAGTEVATVRLNYAVEPRYGVLVDIATSVHEGRPVDVTTGQVNVIWQGDACNQILLSLAHAASPPKILNVTGPETLGIRALAERLGELLGKTATFTGSDSGRAYLSDATEANTLFGPPRVSIDQVCVWTAHWIEHGGPLLGKPTHFETQDGKY